MPNGGSDCCATCWFNRKNKGEAGPFHEKDPGEAYCEIRDVAIDNPFWTYCVNHPYRSPDRDTIPIGPIYIDRGKGRQLWQHSPDTESIRSHLLKLLEQIQEHPRPEYRAGYPRDAETFFRDEVVVWQLGNFEEQRALNDLKRIMEFDPAASVGEPIYRTRETLVEAAHEAMAKILGHESNGA